MAALSEQLDALPADVIERLSRHGFDRARFMERAERLRSGTTADNRVEGLVEPPAAGDVRALPERGTAEHDALSAAGMEVLRRGECALVVLAGGMATRMGGVVKALVEALPYRSFLDLRLGENASLARAAGRSVPLWLMTSHATDADIRQALGSRVSGDELAVFAQGLSLRLTPSAELYLDEHGRPSEYAPGHGDLPDALRASGLLGRFVQRGGRVVMVANLDNLGATVDPAVIGWHLAHGAPVSCEVVDKLGSDRGGIPARWNGRPVVLEEFRLPEAFDPGQVRVFNTNTFCFDAKALFELDMEWTYFKVEKKNEGEPVIQFERLIGEVTSHLDTRFLLVPRQGVESRFLPVKDNPELAARRSEIELVARARGML